MRCQWVLSIRTDFELLSEAHIRLTIDMLHFLSYLIFRRYEIYLFASENVIIFTAFIIACVIWMTLSFFILGKLILTQEFFGAYTSELLWRHRLWIVTEIVVDKSFCWEEIFDDLTLWKLSICVEIKLLHSLLDLFVLWDYVRCKDWGLRAIPITCT